MGTRAMITRLVYAISIPSVVAGIFLMVDSELVLLVTFNIFTKSSTISAMVYEIKCYNYIKYKTT